MKSDRDLIAEWTGEELYAALHRSHDVRLTHNARSEFYLAILRAQSDDGMWHNLSPHERPCPHPY